MTARAFLLNLPQAFWVEVVERLARQGLLEPVYWTSNPPMRERVRSAFPDAVFHARFDAVRGVPPRELADLGLDPLDREVLTDFAHDEALTLQMMERMDIGDSFPYRERVNHYHAQLRYWRTVVRRFAPDVALFYSSPHLVYDYVLYAVCRRMGVRTVILKRTSLPDLNYLAESLDGGSPSLDGLYRSMTARSTDAVTLTPENEAYLERLRGPYEQAEPEYMKVQQKRTEALRASAMARKLLAPTRYPDYARSVGDAAARAVRALIARKPADTLLKERGRSVRERPSVAAYGQLKARSDRRLRRLKARYERLARPADLQRPFVFCALHMQPERTTSPEGDVFVHQELMVELLAACLPPGWRLYVKEHASQFLPEFLIDSSLAQARSFAFYDRLVSHAAVTLVPLDLSSFALADASQAVATVTGTVGWEAVVRGKPVLAFGHPWYQGCDGVFHTPTEATVRAALDAVRDGSAPRHERVRLFVRAIETIGFRAALYSARTGKGDDYGRDLVEACTAALQRALREGSGAPHGA